MLRSVLLTILGILFSTFLISCGSDNPQSEVTKIDGVEIRLNYRPVRGNVPGEVIHPTDMLLVDGIEPHNPEEAMLMRPEDVIAGSDGEIIILDDYQVKVFNENGVFLHSFGRRGAGPGEFEFPWRIPPLHRDRIVIQEANPSIKVTFFSREGDFLKRLLPSVPGFSGIAETRDGGFVLFRIEITGDIIESTRHHTLRLIKENGESVAFQTGDGPLDSLVIANYPRAFEEPYTRRITNLRPLLNSPDGTILAVGSDYTFFRVDEKGLISAFRRVVVVLKYPDWYQAALRERSRRRGRDSTFRKGFWVEPNYVTVDERGHVWAVAYDATVYSFASSMEELQQLRMLPLDEFDERGRWLRQIVIQLPDSLGEMVLTDASHGSFYGLIFPGPEMETTPVIRFRRP